MAISEQFLEELRARLDIESVVSPYVNLRKRGRTSVGLCPFHSEKTPSFTVYPDTQSFYCFGCTAGGEIITFTMRIENLDFAEAVRSLAQKAGLSMPEDGFDDSLAKRRKEILEANRTAARFYHDCLNGPGGEEALAYLEKRGISEKMIQRFGLGYSPANGYSLHRYLRSNGFSDTLLLEASLIKKSHRDPDRPSYYDFFYNRLMFPIIDLRGNVIAFGARTLGNEQPKYINTSDTLVYKKSQGIFALNFAKNGNDGRLILTEGYMDVIALHQAGITNAVACLGTALTNDQVQLITRYADKIFLAYDSDEAGREAARKALRLFNNTGAKVKVLQLAGGKDPDEIIRKYGADYFVRSLEDARNEIEFKLEEQRAQFDLSTADGKLGFLTQAAQILAAVPGELEREVYVQKLAAEFAVSPQSLLDKVRVFAQAGRKKSAGEAFRKIQRFDTARNPVNPDKALNRRAANAEERIIAVLLNDPDYFPKLKREMTPDLFITDFNRKVITAIFERLALEKEISLTALAAEFTPAQMGIIAGILAAGAAIRGSMEECLDCIAVLREEKAKREMPDPAQMSDGEFARFFEQARNNRSGTGRNTDKE